MNPPASRALPWQSGNKMQPRQSSVHFSITSHTHQVKTFRRPSPSSLFITPAGPFSVEKASMVPRTLLCLPPAPRGGARLAPRGQLHRVPHFRVEQVHLIAPHLLHACPAHGSLGLPQQFHAGPVAERKAALPDATDAVTPESSDPENAAPPSAPDARTCVRTASANRPGCGFPRPA